MKIKDFFRASKKPLTPWRTGGSFDCFEYGESYGCSCECPVFRRGGCLFDNEEFLTSMIEKSVELDEESRNRLYDLYPNLKEYRNNLNKQRT
jgi:hypothetical protein